MPTPDITPLFQSATALLQELEEKNGMIDRYYGDVEREIAGTLDYSTAGEIRVSERGFEGGDYTLKLNGAGYVESISGMDNTFDYDNDGHLTKHTWDGGKCWMTLGYNADGVISEGVLHEPGYDDENIGEGGEAMFGTEENDQLNVDVNMLFLYGLYSNYDWYEGNENYVSTDTVIMGRSLKAERRRYRRWNGKRRAHRPPAPSRSAWQRDRREPAPPARRCARRSPSRWACPERRNQSR